MAAPHKLEGAFVLKVGQPVARELFFGFAALLLHAHEIAECPLVQVVFDKVVLVEKVVADVMK